MIYETRFERHTKGLVFGPAILSAPQPVALPIGLCKGRFTPLADSRIMPHVEGVATFKVSIRARESGELIWMRAFATRFEAVTLYSQLVGPAGESCMRRGYLPGRWVDGDVEYIYAIVSTYTASNSTNADWPTGNKCPTGITATDILVVAGGGSGGTGDGHGGGGGSGGLLEQTARSVTPGTQYTITVGAGGAGNASSGNNGNNSVFDTATANAGGKGGTNFGTAVAANAGGSAGGGASTGTTTAGTANQGSSGGATGYGNNGGAGNSGAGAGGGGGGAGATGSAGSGTVGGNGASGRANSISGSSVTYAGGGGGAGTTAGNGGSGGGGKGDNITVAAQSGTANSGGGGGGGRLFLREGGSGGSGIIILSYTPQNVVWTNIPMIGM